MGTVRASSLLWCLVDLDVLDDQVAGVKTLGVGVGLGVLEEREEELGGLDWPAGLGDTELLACVSFHEYFVLFSYVCILAAGRLTLCGATSAPGIASHWDCLDVSLDVLEVCYGAAELPSIDGLRGLAGVLERHTEVGSVRPCGLCIVDGGCCVSDLVEGVSTEVV